jgi:hypothetical protein
MTGWVVVFGAQNWWIFLLAALGVIGIMIQLWREG